MTKNSILILLLLLTIFIEARVPNPEQDTPGASNEVKNFKEWILYAILGGLITFLLIVALIIEKMLSYAKRREISKLEDQKSQNLISLGQGESSSPFPFDDDRTQGLGNDITQNTPNTKNRESLRSKTTFKTKTKESLMPA